MTKASLSYESKEVRTGGSSRRFRTRPVVVLAICIAALLSPDVIADTQVGHQEIVAQVAHAIELTVPAAYDWGVLSIGENESSLQDIIVRSTAPYDLFIRADRTRLAEYDLASGHYVSGGRELKDSLQWKEASMETYFYVDTIDLPVISGGSPTGSDGTVISLLFRQIVDYGDQALPDGLVYRIVLTYTAMNTV